VGGVAQERDPAAAPALERLQVVDVVAQDVRLPGRARDRRDRLVPAREAPQDLGLAPAGFVRLALGGVLGREPVRPRAPDGDEPESLTDPPRLAHPPRLDRYARNAAPCRVGMEAEVLVKREQSTLLVATFMHLRNPLARAVWTAFAPKHWRVLHHLVKEAGRRARGEAPDG
jgi:hypothetical protein